MNIDTPFITYAITALTTDAPLLSMQGIRLICILPREVGPAARILPR